MPLFGRNVKLPGANIEEDIKTDEAWSSMWDLPLNPIKLQGGNGIRNVMEVTEDQDPGVTITSNFDHAKQCNSAMNKTRIELFKFTSSMSRTEPNVFGLLSVTAVRTHLGYCVQTRCTLPRNFAKFCYHGQKSGYERP